MGEGGGEGSDAETTTASGAPAAVTNTVCGPSYTAAIKCSVALAGSPGAKVPLYSTPGFATAILAALRKANETNSDLLGPACNTFWSVSMAEKNSIPMLEHPGLVSTLLDVMKKNSDAPRKACCIVLGKLFVPPKR
jgi:hypothetical protein